ncbi:MAG: Spy/CpxP family protein refolding chaperone [Motiliproteus sp.]
MKKTTGVGIGIAALLLSGAAMVATADSDGCRGQGGMGYSSMGGDQMMGKHDGKGYGKRDPQKMQQKMLQRLDKQLSLSDEQKQQLGELMAKHQSGMQKPKQSMQQFRTQMHELDPAASDYQAQVEVLAKQQAELMSQKIVDRATQHAEMFALLTPEQQQQYRQMDRGGKGKKW